MNPKKSGQLLFLLMISPIFIVGLVIYLLIANTPAEEKARNKQLFEQQKILAQQIWQQQKEQEEKNRLAIDGAKTQPNEKRPVYDYQKYGLIKRDYRYFLVPREYVGASGFHFYWPLGIEKEFKDLRDPNNRAAIDKMNKAAITVFMESKYAPMYRGTYATDVAVCSQTPTSFKSKDIIISLRFDKSHIKDWPAICQETLRILNLVKEVKP